MIFRRKFFSVSCLISWFVRFRGVGRRTIVRKPKDYDAVTISVALAYAKDRDLAPSDYVWNEHGRVNCLTNDRAKGHRDSATDDRPTLC